MTHVPATHYSRQTLWSLSAALAAVELLVIGLAYSSFEFTCRDFVAEAYCAFSGHIVSRGIGVLAMLAVLLAARPSRFGPLFAQGSGNLWPWMLVNLFGAVLVLLPSFVLSDASPTAIVFAGVGAWTVGGIAATAGLMLMVAPASSWRALIRSAGGLIAIGVLIGLSAPELRKFLFEIAYPLWHKGGVTEITFEAVTATMRMIGYSITTDPSIQYINVNGFDVRVGPQCSGIEGFVLITVFLTGYIALFRKDLRFPHVLLLYPLGLAVSWVFNVLRIVVLMAIGAEISPELAIGGFHSHAGWLTFTILSVGLIAASRAIPFFRAEGPSQAPSLPPFFADPVVARILPFIVFMASALLASTFSETPSLLYPWRALAVAAALALFLPIYSNLEWRVTPPPLLVGAAVGLMWVLVPTGPAGAPPYGALTGGALALWLVARGVGTIVLIPVVEELFFRGYLEKRLRFGKGQVFAILAAILTAAAFAALHDRWVEAFVAGLVFSWAYARRGRITDAILAHAVANAIVFAVAFATGQMHII